MSSELSTDKSKAAASSASTGAIVVASTSSNKSASLTVINELPEVEAEISKDGKAPRGNKQASNQDATEVLEPEESEDPEQDEELQVKNMGPLPPIHPPSTLLAPADMLRLQRKHEKALRRANQKAKKRRRKQGRVQSSDREDAAEEQEEEESKDNVGTIRRTRLGRRKRSRLPKASTCKSALIALYYTATLLSAVSAALLLFVGLYYKVKSALIAGTLLAFTAFGLCTNHCVSQSLGVAKPRSPEERAAAEEESRILAAVTERNLSMAPRGSTVTAVDHQRRRKSSTPAEADASTNSADAEASAMSTSATAAATARVAMASAVDCLLARRLSTLGVCPDPATRLMMRHHQPINQLHPRRRSSMLHLARSMSIACPVHHHDPTWMAHPVTGLDDYNEFV